MEFRMKIKAIFKGADDSLGYKFNMEYDLIIRNNSAGMIIIEKEEGGGWCAYSSIITFLENWNNIRWI
jgi:hypothetical protein